MAQNELFTPPSPVIEEYEYRGETFKVGDVIINRKENITAVFAGLFKHKLESPLPNLLPDINLAAPEFYVAYLGENGDGNKIVVSVFDPQVGIGSMKGFELATPDEIKKFEEALLAEGHIRYKHPELSFEYIPVIGDKVVAWNGHSGKTAIVGIVESVSGVTAVLNDGRIYQHIVLYYDDHNYKSILKFTP
ncbi:MAG: hypothetical protein NC548_42155 [Lachnospiraceae bacterium]|nr:hypothetical protein [Lachnospiraceae bacterium]